jgi:hypothetical protein
VGYTYSYNAQKEDILVLKTDQAGILLWNKTYGGINSDWGWAVQQTRDGGYIIAGDTWSADPGSCNVWLIKIAPPSHPPQTPMIPQGPSMGVVNVSYTYSTSTLDSPGTEVKYYFDWGDGTGNWTNYSASGVIQNASHKWSSPGVYHLRVKAQNWEGAHSNWSPFFALTISPNSPPSIPHRPIGVETGKIREPHSYSTQTTDPDNNQVYYLFDWGDGTTLEWVGPYPSGETITQLHTWMTQGTYHVRVKARDDHTVESQWSESLVVAMPYFSHPWLDLLYDLFKTLFDYLESKGLTLPLSLVHLC